MRSLARALALMLAPALALVVPLASADCTADLVCTSEYEEGDADCSQPGGYHYGETTISTPAATVRGSSFCQDTGEGGVVAINTISVSAAGAAIAWSSSGASCAMWVQQGEEFTLLPCATPAPDPGWGHLLP